MSANQYLLPAAIVLFSIIYSFGATRYVDSNNSQPLAPYISWQTAAATIQDAIDVSDSGDELLVTNGVYGIGGRVPTAPYYPYYSTTNRVTVDKPLAIRSINGPQCTIILGHQVPGTTNGDSAIRCAFLVEGSSLSGFTLTNGATKGIFTSQENQNGG